LHGNWISANSAFNALAFFALNSLSGARTQAAGLVLGHETDAGQRYAIASDHVRIAIAELLEQAVGVTYSSAGGYPELA
jgi:hypothetical protein